MWSIAQKLGIRKTPEDRYGKPTFEGKKLILK